MNKKGFTLIELLIVVAIIAILAAIAIPNFLQAQVRSKVSRAKADMRSVATGLETYYVDNNDYPMCNRYTSGGSGPELGRKNFHIPNSLTTPISYITSYPMDPFERFGGGQNPLKYIKAGPMYNDGALFMVCKFTRHMAFGN
jgi:type II secretion system protein G